MLSELNRLARDDKGTALNNSLDVLVDFPALWVVRPDYVNLGRFNSQTHSVWVTGLTFEEIGQIWGGN